jgi:uncharacterized membrane protein YoaK (UPF0700 family)
VKKAWKDALTLGVMQFFSWGICTVSWRAVSQANIGVSILADTTLGSLQFFIIKKITKQTDDEGLIPWAGFTVGGVMGTVAGIYFSLWLLGK